MINTRLKYYTNSSWFALLFFLVAVILTGFIASNVPLYSDDIYYANFVGCSEKAFCPERNYPLFDYIAHHRQISNGRFGDMFIPWFVLIPNWIYGILYALFYGGIILLMARLARLSFKDSPIALNWLVIFTVLFFPWFDLFFTRAVFLNYYPPALLLLVVVSVFISERRFNIAQEVLFFALGVLTGWWHEISSIILLPAALIYWCFTKRITRNQLLIGVGIAIGFFLNISAEGFAARMALHNKVIIADYKKYFCLILTAVFFLMAILAVIICYKNKSDRKEKALIWALTFTLIPGAGLTLLTINEARMLFCSSLLVMVAFFRTIPIKFYSNLIIKILCYIGCLATLIHLSLFSYNTHKVYKAYESIIDQAQNHPEETIYYDLKTLITEPEILYLYKSYALDFVNQYDVKDFPIFTHGEKVYSIVPPALKNFDSSKAELVDSPIKTYKVDNYLIIDSPTDSANYLRGMIVVEYVNGKTVPTYYIGNYFEDIHNVPLMYLFCYFPTAQNEEPIRVKQISYDVLPR